MNRLRMQLPIFDLLPDWLVLCYCSLDGNYHELDNREPLPHMTVTERETVRFLIEVIGHDAPHCGFDWYDVCRCERFG